MHLDISHTTRFDYDQDVQLGPHLLYLRPRENPLLHVKQFSLEFTPSAKVDWMRDDFDNLPASVQFSLLARVVEIRSVCSVATADNPPFDFLVRDYARTFPFAYEPLHRFNLGIYLTLPDQPTQTALKAWLGTHFTLQPNETVSWLFGLNQTLSRTLKYQRRDTEGIQSPLQTAQLGTGSCRDYAVLLVAIARTMGLAARFVSGYVFDVTLDTSKSGDMHAWAEVFLPGAGWRALDPTYGLFCNNTYVPVAHAVVAESVNPVQGSFSSVAPAVAKLTTDVRVRAGAA